MKRGPYLSKGVPKRGIAHFKYSEERDLRSLEIPPTLTTWVCGLGRSYGKRGKAPPKAEVCPP